MWYPSLKKVFEDHCKPNDSPEAQLAGARSFVDHFRRDLGLTRNEHGRPVIREARMRPSQFSLRGLAESLVGYEWAESLGNHQSQAFRVFEAGGNPAIAPGNIPNVSAYLGSVTGLLDAALLEAYDTPEYIIDELVPMEPSKTRQKKLLGLGRIGDQAERRNPGDPHSFAQFRDRYVTTPETYDDALAGSVTFEAVFFDQTDQVLQQMDQIGNELALRKELDGFKVICGATNPYNYNGTAYNTFLTSGNWVNDVENELNDWTDVNVANAMFSRMTDQESSNRIAVQADTILCSPTKQLTAQYIQASTEIETRTASGAQVRHAPRLGDVYKVKSSAYLDQVLTTAAASGGLALTQAQADEYWWLMKTDPKRSSFVRVENWPVSINQARPDDFTMLNHKLLLAVFADQMHVFALREPRYVIRNKNES